jgi:hypothetical protein
MKHPDELLIRPLFHLMNELNGPLDDKVKSRLTWLQDRILAALQPK